MSSSNSFPLESKVCPQLGLIVAGGQITYQSTSEGLIEWWRCSACDRWHLSNLKPKDSIEVELVDNNPWILPAH